MKKIKIELPKAKNKKNNNANPNKLKYYMIAFSLKIISGFLIIFLLFFQLECLLLFLIKMIIDNTYYIIILLIITHIIIIRFLIQSILYVLRCPFIDSICFYSISCNQMLQLFNCSKDFVSLYKKIKNNKTVEQKDIIVIDDFGNIINGYLYFFKTIKKSGKLSQNQNALYEKLEIIMQTFDDYHKYLESINNNENNIKEEEKEISKENINQYLISFIKKMAFDSNDIKNILSEFICDNHEFFSFKSLYNCFINNDFFNIDQFSILFRKRFNNKYKFFITSDNQLIDYTIISYEKLSDVYKKKRKAKNGEIENKENTEKIFLKKNLLFYCNPNGMIYQLFTPDKFLPLLEGGCDILLWNYRGYGASTGYPTFKNAKMDALELFDYAKKKFTNYNKFGVYGYSVGGGSAIFLANQRNLDALICDRNFSSVGDIVKDISYIGVVLYYLLKILNFKYDYNISEYMNSKNKNICKVVLCDPEDEIIPNCASLKSGISTYIIKKYCEERKIKTRENILEIFLESRDNLSDKFIEALLYISSILKRFNENPFQDLIPEKQKNEKNNKNKKDIGQLNDLLLLNISDNITFDKKSFKNLLIKTIIKIFNCFKFSSENLEDFKKKDEKRLKILHINNYFNNFIVWGSISKDNISEKNGFKNPFNVKNNILYLNNAINYIDDFFKDKNTNNLENNEDYKIIFDNLNIIKYCLQIILDKSKYFELEKRINIGDLIRLNCGHNGNFSKSDRQNLIDILQENKFLCYDNYICCL